MRKMTVAVLAVAALASASLAVAARLDEGKSVRAVAGTFTAATVSNSQTRSCTITGGDTVATTNATYNGTATGDADLTGNITLQLRSTIDTTAGVGVVTGKVKIAASGGDTVAHLEAVYDHGTLAGIAEGHAQHSHASLLANLSGTFDAAKGFPTGGAIGKGAVGGSAVELGPARCTSTKTPHETSSARGVVSLTSTSITVAGLTCTIPASLSAKVSSTVKNGDFAEIHCALVNGVNTLVDVDKKGK